MEVNQAQKSSNGNLPMKSEIRWSPVFAVMFLAVLAILSSSVDASAQLIINIDRENQTMIVTVDGRLYASWLVSTARPKFRTPTGTFRPKRLERVWFSTIYDNAPMPNSIFFLGGYAIHGTTEIRNLGKPVSHGCVRLHPSNAAVLFDLVKSRPLGSTLIKISFFPREGSRVA